MNLDLSFYINRNDLQELNFLLTNGVILSNKSVDIKAVAVECFNSTDRIKSATDTKLVPSNYVLVNIRYDQYELIKEYLLWQ